MYTVEETTRIGTLPADKGAHVYEVRGGNVLHVGAIPSALATAMGADATYHAEIPARIILKAHLAKGMHWKGGPRNSLRECEVMGFVTLKVPAGEYRNVAKLRVAITYISSKTGKEELFANTFEYYAPDIGLVRTDLVKDDGHIQTFIDLVKYVPGA